MARGKFEKNKMYYLEGRAWKLNYVEEDIEGFYHFKVVEHDDKEEDWMLYQTKDKFEILSDRKEWLISIKDNAKQDPL